MAASAEPLLSTSVRKARSAPAQWFARSVDTAYLSSRTSRRHFWKYALYLVPLFVFDDALDVLLFETETPAILIWDVGFAMWTLLLAVLPVNTIKSDVVIVAAALGLYVPSLSLVDDYTAELWAPFTVEIVVFVCSAGGLHPIMVTVLGIGLLVECFSTVDANHHTIESTTLLVLVMVCFMTGLESLISHYFQELRDQTTTMQRLLDRATDGYCVVCRQSGAILSASSSFLRALDRSHEGLMGSSIFHMVLPGDRGRVERLLENTTEGDHEMVTCRRGPPEDGGAGAAEFEARLVPYKVADADVCLTLQIIGEMRMATRGPASDSTPTAGADGSTMGHARPTTSELGAALQDSGAAPRTASNAEELFHRRFSELPPEDCERLQRQMRGTDTAGGSAPRATEEGSTPQTTEVAGPDLWVTFDSGHPDFVIQDCSPELLPERGQLTRWFPETVSRGLEQWILDALRHSDEDGNCPGEIQRFELNIPPNPVTKIKARRAFVRKEPDQEAVDGTVTLPAVLCLQGVTMEQKVGRSPLPGISEDGQVGVPGAADDGEVSVSPSDSPSQAGGTFLIVP